MFTVSDFISILRHFHRHALGHEQFARLNIKQWRGGWPGRRASRPLAL